VFLKYMCLLVCAFVSRICVSMYMCSSKCMDVSWFICFFEMYVYLGVSLEKCVSWGLNVSRCNNNALIVNTTELICILIFC